MPTRSSRMSRICRDQMPLTDLTIREADELAALAELRAQGPLSLEAACRMLNLRSRSRVPLVIPYPIPDAS